MNKRLLILGLLLGLLMACGKTETTPTPAPVQQQNPEPELVLSSDKQITSFVFQASDNLFDIQVAAIINQENKTITATLPSDTPLTNLTPVLLISEKASINLTGAQDFTTPVTYTLTAEDGTTSSYTATAISNSSAKQITSFVFLLTNNPIDLNVVATIDDENKTITAAMPPGTDLSGLLPEVQLSELATVDLTAAQNFEEPVAYSVTAEDGTESEYVVTITTLLTQRQILQAILEANPDNTLPWDLNTTANLDALAGVTTNTEGQIIKLRLDDNLISIPKEIGQLTNLEDLNVGENQLTSIPKEIGQLTNLTRLHLGDNQLTAIPPEIGQLINLSSLFLSQNQLSELPAEMNQLVNLKVLSLNSNNLSEFDHVAFIPSGGNTNILDCATETNLEVLRLSGNPDLKTLNQCVCDLDLDKGGTVAIDVVPDGVKCVGNNVIGN